MYKRQVWKRGSVCVTDFMKVSLIVKAAIEAHIRRMPRRFSEIGNSGVLPCPSLGIRRRGEGEVSTVDRFSERLESSG